jgi:hypothetical protein
VFQNIQVEVLREFAAFRPALSDEDEESLGIFLLAARALGGGRKRLKATAKARKAQGGLK